MSGPEIVMLDQRIISLMQELPAHPKLYARLLQAEAEGTKAAETIFHLKRDEEIPLIQTFEQAVGFLAAEVDIALHGDYSHEDICDICNRIRIELVERRAILVGNLKTEPKKLDRIVLQSDYKH
jgi:hypothetical protein